MYSSQKPYLLKLNRAEKIQRAILFTVKTKMYNDVWIDWNRYGIEIFQPIYICNNLDIQSVT